MKTYAGYALMQLLNHLSLPPKEG